MTVVFPIKNQKDYTELKFSLRSLEKFLKPPFDVVIVGEKIPDWITGITHIQLPDTHGRKQISIKRKILAALEYSKEDIFFTSDDTYLTKPFKNQYYYSGTLKGYSESGSQPLYKQLVEMGKPVKNFDIHYPLIYKKDFSEIILNFCDDCIIKSSYCNFLEIEGSPAQDCKIIKQMSTPMIRAFIKDKPCFQTGAYTVNSALPILEEMFPTPSVFEIC